MARLFNPEDDSIRRIHDQFTHLVKTSVGTPFAVPSGPVLTREQLAEFVETAFWASLRSEEGQATRVCVAVVAPESFPDAVRFATPVTYKESQISKLAPAVPQGGCLLISGSADGLSIWGFGRRRPNSWPTAVTIELSEPGSLRLGIGPFRSFAVLNGRSDSIIASTNVELAHYLLRVLRKALPTDDILETQAVWRECLALVDLARMIFADGHGGAVLIVPSETGEWSKALDPFAYRFAAPDTTIRDVIRQELKEANAQGEWLQRLSQAPVPDDLKNLATGLRLAPLWGGTIPGVRATASLAAVDGAVVVTRDLRVLGFGAKIVVQSDLATRVCMFQPRSGTQEVVPSPLEDLGGTRHQSAARFAAANKDTVALVISQDRRVSVMHWDDKLDSVVVIRNVEWWI